MSNYYIAPDGTWRPGSHSPDVPVQEPLSFLQGTVGPFYDDLYINSQINTMQYTEAQEPVNAWEMIKVFGSAWGRILADTLLPIAEWDAVGRGQIVQAMQSPNVVAGNAYQMGRLDRYGPFNDPRQSQTALENYLASAMPREVTTLEAQTQPGGTMTLLGYGRPGG